MKKSRIFFAALLILTLLAAPACADMFYLCDQGDSYKVSAFTAPNLVWGEYPRGLKFSKDNYNGVGIYSFECNETSWMMASAYNKTDTNQTNQYTYVYPYKVKGWGELNPDDQRIEFPGTILNPRGAVQVDNLYYVIDRGANDATNGSVTLYSIEYNTENSLPKFTKLSSMDFSSIVSPGSYAHPEAIFTAAVSGNTEVFVLLSRPGNEKNLLVRLKYENNELTLDKEVELKTSAFDGLSHKPCVMTMDSSPYLFLACGDNIEQVDLSSIDTEGSSELLYSSGSGEDDWADFGFKFTDVVFDGSNAYVIAQGKNTEDPEGKPFYVRLYTIKANDFLDTETLAEKTMPEPLQISEETYHQSAAFTDEYKGYNRILLFLGNNIYLYNKKYTEGELGGAFITAIPCKSSINQPTSQDYGDGGSGCNAGCSAAMLLFCAAPLFFRKKR